MKTESDEIQDFEDHNYVYKNKSKLEALNIRKARIIDEKGVTKKLFQNSEFKQAGVKTVSPI